MSTRKNKKQKPFGIVGAIPEFFGAMAGTTIVTGRYIKHQVRNLLGEKPRRPKKAAKTNIQLEAEKRIAAIEEKMSEQKQVKAVKKTVPASVKTREKSTKKTIAKKTKK